MLPLVVHLLPYDGIGGAEIAARSVECGEHSGFRFELLYLTENRHSENSPSVYLSAVSKLLSARPDALIASLWRSYLVLIALKLIRPKTHCVTFLHSAVDMHFVDRWLSRLAMLLSSEIWADSQATIKGRVPNWLRSRARVISFLTEHKPPPRMTTAGPRFIFWGRLHWQKNIPRAVRFFALIAKHYPSASFDIIGPDNGAKKDIDAEISRLGLTGVRLHGAKPREEIFEMARGCSFYLQTSVEEGAAMSVIEAMQLGLVPVVTPVGEIGSYCFDGDNAIIVHDDQAAATRLLKLLDYFHSLQSVAARAYRTWSERPLYRDDVLSACRHVLQRQ